MRNSELMRRRANVSTLDLGRIKSDLQAIGEISQEGKKTAIPVCIILGFFFFSSSSSKMTYLWSQLCIAKYYPYPHMYIVHKQVAYHSITCLKCLIIASVVMHLFMGDCRRNKEAYQRRNL